MREVSDIASESVNKINLIEMRCFLCLVCFMAIGVLGHAQTIVETNSGKVEGFVNSEGDIRIFKGIPYAAPPVGDLRWEGLTRHLSRMEVILRMDENKKGLTLNFVDMTPPAERTSY